MGAEETRGFLLCYLLQYLQLHLRLILPLLQMQKLRLRGVILAKTLQLVCGKTKTQIFLFLKLGLFQLYDATYKNGEIISISIFVTNI